MKHQLPFLMGAVMMLPQASQAVLQFGLDDTWTQAKLQMPLGRKPFSEMLLDCSRAAQANVFVDATGVALQVPIDSPSKFATPEAHVFPSRGFALRNIAAQAGMQTDRTEPHTFVAWPKEDLNLLVSLIVAEQQKFDEAHPTGDRAATIAALKDFYQAKGWNPNPQTVAEKNQSAQGVNDTIRLSDLPPALQGPVLAELVLRLRWLNNDGMLQNSYVPAAWNDDSWKNARVCLHINPLNEQGKPYRPGDTAAAFVSLIAPPNLALPHQAFQVGQVRDFRVSWQAPQAQPLPRLAWPLAPRRRLVCAPAEATVGVPPQTAPASESGFTFDASQEAALQKKVAFVHQGVAPSVVVADWSKQSGVSLRLAPDVAPKAKIIALSGGMTLESAMRAMARLYSAQWSKDGGGFVLRSTHLDELHLMMAHMGYCAYYPLWPRSIQESLRTGNELAGQIATSVDEDQLKSEQGVVFSSLPLDLQKSVLSLMREENVGEMIVSQQRVDDVLSSDVQLRFAPVSKDSPQFFGAFYTEGGLTGSSAGALLGAYTADGRYITRLFPEFSAPKINQWDERKEEIAKQQEAHKAQQEGQNQ